MLLWQRARTPVDRFRTSFHFFNLLKVTLNQPLTSESSLGVDCTAVDLIVASETGKIKTSSSR